MTTVLSPRSRATEHREQTRLVQGRVVGEDSFGNEWRSLSGEFILAVTWDRGARHYKVTFKDGIWSAVVEQLHRINLAIAEISIAGKEALLKEPKGNFSLDGNATIEIRVRMPHSSVLRVIDDVTGIDLADIALVSVQGFDYIDIPHPGIDYSDRVVARGLNSPIILDSYAATLRNTDFSRARGYDQFLVGAEGYAWTLLNCDFRVGGQQTIAMQRSAGLTVHLIGVDEAAHEFLRLRASESPIPVAEVLLTRSGDLEIDGLRPSDLAVTVEIGPCLPSPVVLGETSVVLRAGEHPSVAITLEPAPPFVSATASGLLNIAKEWGCDRQDLMLILELLDTPVGGFDDHQMLFAERTKPSLDGFDSFSWSTEAIQAGQYDVQLYQLPLRLTIDLPEGHSSGFEWTLPPPIELSVYVVDAVTGEAATIETLRWAPHRSEGLDIWHSLVADYDDHRHCYVIRAPEVSIDLATWSWDYQLFEGTLNLRAGVREHTIRLERAYGIVVELANRGSPVAFPEGWFGRLMPVSGEGRCVLADRGDFERRFTVSEPGAYLLEIPKLSGYLPVPIQTIEILPGEFGRHVVELDLE